MDVYWANTKKILRYAHKHGCTVEMLYLDDLGRCYPTPDDLDGYHGEISSILAMMEGCDVVSRRVKYLIKHGVPEELAHKCAMIHMGILGTIDYNYLDRYPVCKELITQVGSIVKGYYQDVANTEKLYKITRGIIHVPDYTIDTSTVVCELSVDVDMVHLFENTPETFDILMEVTPGGIRRKVSRSYPPKSIDRKYIRPTVITRPMYVMVRSHGEDYTVTKSKFTVQRKGIKRVDTVIPLEIIREGGYRDATIVNQYDTDIRIRFNHTCIWHRRVMAYIMTNHEPYKDIIVVDKDVDYGTPYGKQEREMLSITVLLTGTRCSIRNKYVVISNASDEYTVVTTVAILGKLLELYENICGDVYATLSGLMTIPAQRPKRVKSPGKTKIEDLRRRLPELFTSNYTRECHRLPLMLEGKEEAHEYMNVGRVVIKYPKTGPHARWYTSPDPGLYVGLKVNRLSNKEAFKYIVVCYTSNHLVNPSKRTYQYYYNEDTPLETKHMEDIKTLKALGVDRKGPIPHAMEAEYGVQGYKRLGVGGTFRQCMDVAMGEKDVRRAIRDHPVLLHVIGQDSAGAPIETELPDGVVSYRLFEEIYRCNIILVQVDHRGKYRLCIPRKDYIWEVCPRYKSYVLVLKNIRRLYSDVSITYELIIRDDTYVHHRDDDLVSKLVVTKLESTVRPYYSTKVRQSKIRYQHLDEEGRCVMVILKDDTVVECTTRPYPCAIMDKTLVLERCSVLYGHNGERPWLSTNKKYLYFPDDASFMVWLDY